MALPVNTTPIYTLTIPSTQQTVKFRPFRVKQEKALLIAQQSEDVHVMMDTLKVVISECVIDSVDTDNMPSFDAEYIFAQIRAKSVGEIVELFFLCNEDHGADNDKAKVKMSFDLTQLKVFTPEGHVKTIPLFDDVGVIMKYPTLDVLKRIHEMDENDIDAMIDITADCIESIYNTDEIFRGSETPKADLTQFLDNLESGQFSLIQNFFNTMPRIKQEIDYNCPVCDKAYHTTLEGINSFF